MKRILYLCTALALSACVTSPPISDGEINKRVEENNSSAAMQKQNSSESAISGTWHGYYDCRQGRTFLTLELVEHRNGGVNALFDFNVKNQVYGRFSMSGQISPTSGRLKLNPQAWIKQPRGYEMVTLSGTLNQKSQTYSGSVGASGCSSFLLSKNPTRLRKMADELKSGRDSYVATLIEQKVDNSKRSHSENSKSIPQGKSHTDVSQDARNDSLSKTTSVRQIEECVPGKWSDDGIHLKVWDSREPPRAGPEMEKIKSSISVLERSNMAMNCKVIAKKKIPYSFTTAMKMIDSAAINQGVQGKFYDFEILQAALALRFVANFAMWNGDFNSFQNGARKYASDLLQMGLKQRQASLRKQDEIRRGNETAAQLFVGIAAYAALLELTKPSASAGSSSYSSSSGSVAYKYECSFCCEGQFGVCRSDTIKVRTPYSDRTEAERYVHDAYDKVCAKYPFYKGGGGSASVSYQSCDPYY